LNKVPTRYFHPLSVCLSPPSCPPPQQHPGQQQGSRGILIDGVFGLLVTEKVACRVCGRETHKVPAHYEHLIVVNSASLNLSALSLEGAGMDQLLAFLFEQEQKFCDKDEGGCGEPNVSRGGGLGVFSCEGCGGGGEGG
jgi:hypothetical protein